MRYALDFRASAAFDPGPPLRLEGLEWDETLEALAFTRLPGDPIVFASRRLGPAPKVDPSRPSAIACADVGGGTRAVFFSSPAWDGGRLVRFDVESGGSVSEPRPWPTDDARFALNPTGLAVGPRDLLAVAMPDQGRVVLLDARTGLPRGELTDPPARPTSLAWGPARGLYVSGDGGLRRFGLDGRYDPAFDPGCPGEGLEQAGPIAYLTDGTLAVDLPSGLRRFDPRGASQPWPGTEIVDLPLAFPETAGRIDWDLGGGPWGGRSPAAGRAAALVAAAGRVEIALRDDLGLSPQLHVLNPRTLRLTAATTRVLALAVAPPARPGACSAIADRLLALEVRGDSLAVVAYDPRAARARRGSVRLGPLVDDAAAPWRTLRVETAADWPDAVRAGLATLTTSPLDAASPADLEGLELTNPPPTPDWYASPPPPGNDQAAQKSFPFLIDLRQVPDEPDSADDRNLTEPGRWRRGPDDVREARLWHQPSDPNRPSEPLWAALYFQGDGAATPAILGLTIGSGGSPWLPLLPAIYSRDRALGFGSDRGAPAPGAGAPIRLLDGLLDLLASSLDERDAAIDALPDFFDPGETPDPDALATHLGLDPAEFPPSRLRKSLAPAWRESSQRSTPGGFVRALKEELRLDVRLDEAGTRAGLWVLGETGELGLETQLSAVSLGAAALDVSALIDGSVLSGEAGGPDPAGEALWGDGPSSLVVRVFAADVARPGVVEALRAGLDHSAPAYLMPVVEVIGPRARVGRQSILGVDAVVAREALGARPWRPPEPLGPGRSLGTGRARPPRGRLPLRVGLGRIA